MAKQRGTNSRSPSPNQETQPNEEAASLDTWQDTVPHLLEEFYQLYLLAEQKTLVSPNVRCRAALETRQKTCETAFVAKLKSILGCGATYERVLALLPADTSTRKQEIWRNWVLLAYLEVHRAPP
jgi:hypothetical protein